MIKGLYVTENIKQADCLVVYALRYRESEPFFFPLTRHYNGYANHINVR